jgi:exonuclease-1
MGIQGLLLALRPLTRVAHLNDFRGQTCAVDASAWLHRASYGCALELATGQDTVMYLHFCMDMIDILKKHGITPTVVFDGARLPMKDCTRESRRRYAQIGFAVLCPGPNLDAPFVSPSN